MIFFWKDADMRQMLICNFFLFRMLAHKFVEQVSESDLMAEKTKPKSSWWSFGWLLFFTFLHISLGIPWTTYTLNGVFFRIGSSKDDSEHRGFTEEDWEQLNKIIGYKEGSDDYLLASEEKDIMQFYMEIHMKHNASRLVSEGQNCLADLSCEGLACKIKTYPEAKVIDVTLGSYKLSSPYGLLAEVWISKMCFNRITTSYLSLLCGVWLCIYLYYETECYCFWFAGWHLLIQTFWSGSRLELCC